METLTFDKLEQSLDGTQFVDRGTLILKRPSSYYNAPSQLILKPSQFEQVPIPFGSKDFLSNPLYYLRFTTEYNTTILTSVYTCSLLANHMQDKIDIHANHKDHFIGISLSTEQHHTHCTPEEVQSWLQGSLPKVFKTQVQLHLGTDGPKARNLDPVKTESEESQSWLSKYVCRL